MPRRSKTTPEPAEGATPSSQEVNPAAPGASLRSAPLGDILDGRDFQVPAQIEPKRPVRTLQPFKETDHMDTLHYMDVRRIDDNERPRWRAVDMHTACTFWFDSLDAAVRFTLDGSTVAQVQVIEADWYRFLLVTDRPQDREALQVTSGRTPDRPEGA